MAAARGSSSSSCFKTDGALMVTFPILNVAPRFLPVRGLEQIIYTQISTVHSLTMLTKFALIQVKPEELRFAFLSSS